MAPRLALPRNAQGNRPAKPRLAPPFSAKRRPPANPQSAARGASGWPSPALPRAAQPKHGGVVGFSTAGHGRKTERAAGSTATSTPAGDEVIYRTVPSLTWISRLVTV